MQTMEHLRVRVSNRIDTYKVADVSLLNVPHLPTIALLVVLGGRKSCLVLGSERMVREGIGLQPRTRSCYPDMDSCALTRDARSPRC